MNENIKTGVIGCGYWGKNLVRNFNELGALGAVCDLNESARKAMQTAYGIPARAHASEVLEDPTLQGVVIAASAVQHFSLAKAALLRGKDVFVEKPLALKVSEGEQLVELADKLGRVLMVGHLLEYHPAVRKLKELINAGTLGRIQYIHSTRLNIGKLRTEENILWSFAPHDIAVILSILKELPESVAADGAAYITPKVADSTLTCCRFASGAMAHIFVSWLHPFKEQKLCVVGDRSMAVFDDMEQENKLVLYPHTIEWIERMPVAKKNGGVPVQIEKVEPLKEECRHFLECIRTRQSPLTHGESALQVLRVLDASERSLNSEGKSVSLRVSAAPYFAHSTAVIDEGATIGAETKIWHFSHIMGDAHIGAGCNLGQNVVVSPGCRVGNNVKIQNNVSIYAGVELEDDVFCGPSMVFTNVINPRSHVSRKDEYRRTLVKKGASLGANSTVVCGVTIGDYAFVGAGAVVTHDVQAYALVKGAPARFAGWMCSCGIRLEGDNEVSCPACQSTYTIGNGLCQPLSKTATVSV